MLYWALTSQLGSRKSQVAQVVSRFIIIKHMLRASEKNVSKYKVAQVTYRVTGDNNFSGIFVCKVCIFLTNEVLSEELQVSVKFQIVA